MASEVDICNLALSHIGENAEIDSINPPDGSRHAALCFTYYPVARDVLLESHPWGFAKKRVTLALLGDPPSQWTYRYLLPNDCLKPLALQTVGASDDKESDEYVIEVHGDNNEQSIFCNTESAELRYIFKSNDTGRYTPLFVNALSWLLASYLAGPITKDLKLKNSAYSQYLYEKDLATLSDANGEHLNRDYQPSWIKNR